MEALQNIFTDELIYALGWTVVHSLWQGAIIAFLLGVLMVSLQKHSSHLRYTIANVAMLAMLAWAVVTFITTYRAALAEGEEITLASFSGEAYVESSSFWNSLSLSFSQYFSQNLPLIVSIWLLGFLFFFLKMLGGLAYIEYLKKSHNYPVEEKWQHKLIELCDKLNMRRPIRLVESALVKVPMVIGHVKPVILLPVGAVNQLSAEQVEAILAHELAHIFRNDFFFNILQSVIEALFYFNPAVWWISANIRTERENCCDDVAVSLCDNNLTYAKALVSLQEMSFHAPAMAMPFGKSKNQLLLRIKRILNQPHNKSNIMEKITATGMLLLAMLMLSFGANGSLSKLLNLPATDLEEQIELRDAKAPEMLYVQTDTWSADSIPPKAPKAKRQRLVKHEDGKSYEMTLENGQIVELKINGETIPQNRFQEYEALTEELKADLETPPAPPAPVAPPSWETAPTPPTPGSPVDPPAPPAPRTKIKTRVINAEKDDEGNTMIFFQSEDGSEPVKVRVGKTDGKIIVNEEELPTGEGAVIIKVKEADGNIVINAKELPSGEGAVIIKEIDGDGNLRWFEATPPADDVPAFYWMDEASVEKYGVTHLEQLAELEAQLKDMKLSEKEVEKLKKEIEQELKNQNKNIKERRAHIIHDGEAAAHHAEALAMEREAIAKQGYGFAWQSDRALEERVEAELLKDGLIKDRKNYNFELTNKKLEINGKKMSKALHEKYLEIYEEQKGRPFSEKSRIAIEKDNKGDER